MNQYAKDIIKHLDRITASGHSAYVIFEDFLDLTLACLTALPDHVKSAARNGTFAPETPEAEQLFERLRNRYTSAKSWEHFAQAFHTLLDSTDGESDVIAWDDTIGQIYMDWGVANKHTGQFFTPYSLAQMMAALQDIESQVYKHLEDAYLKTPTGMMHEFMTSRERVTAFVRRMGEDLLPMCTEHFEQIKVNDCSCGSGVMFLAVAEHTPRWALNWGLVQFYGQDIDQTCVKMAQINMMIYGLNGYSLKCALALVPDELLEIPEPFQSAYRQAQTEPDRVNEIAVDLRAWKQEALL